GLQPATRYTYTVRATDGAATPNTSGDSAPASATTRDAPLIDHTPPTVPQNFVAVTQGPHTIELHWDASTDASGILEYLIYRVGGHNDEQKATPVAIATSTSYVDENLEANTRYTYRVRAVDRAIIPNQSAQSDPARAQTLPE